MNKGIWVLTIMAVALISITNAAITDKLLVYYSLDTNGSKTIDSLGLNDATKNGNPYFINGTSDCKIGGCFSFNLTSSGFSSDNNLGITGAQPRTFNFWIKPYAKDFIWMDYGALSNGNRFGLWPLS